MSQRSAQHVRPLLPFVAAITLLALWGAPAALAATFSLPPAAGWATWQAEQADRDGSWQIGGPNGAGERYAQPESGGASLVFPFESDRPTTLRVRPVWWPTGEQKLARRFPYPLVRQPGPDVLDYVGETVFATAPATGRVIAVDAATEKVLSAIEVGGYLADLVADRSRGRVYVADALGDRVVVIDASTRTIAREFTAQGVPWSLALHEGVLYAGCREGKRLLAIEAASGTVLRQVNLPAEPIALELAPASGRLIVRFQHQVLDALTLDPLSPDELEYPLAEYRGPEPPCGGPTCQCQWREKAGPHQLALVNLKGRETVSVSAVTQRPVDPRVAARFGDHPGPLDLLEFWTDDPPVARTFFSSPSQGAVGVLNPDTRAVYAIEVGGYVSDLALSNGPEGDAKLYALDAANDRLVVINAATEKIESEISVPGEPWGVAAIATVAVQREYPWRPTPVNRAYVVCRQTRDLVSISLTEKRVVNRVPLIAEPRSIRFIPMPNPGWWPVMADDRIPFALRPRIGVEFTPLVLDLSTFELTQNRDEVLERAARRAKVDVPTSTGTTKAFSADNDLLLGIDSKRWVDVSAAADPQALPDPSLAARDIPGSITISADEGPERNWAAGIWVAPDNEMFLVNGSEEFWRYNAPAVSVGPGRHTLRVKANSPFARLDAVAVRRAPEPMLEATLLPEPQEVHARVPLASYQGVFYDQEPALFTLRLANRSDAPATVRISWSLRNYLEETVQAAAPAELALSAGDTAQRPIALAPRDTGRFLLTVTIDSPEGQLVREARFLRLPKLEHPRMFFREEDIPAIKARVARYPNLFRRYADWLERMSKREGRFPERFLPPGVTRAELLAVAPEGMPPEQQEEACAWRMYELGWRVLAAQFALLFLKPDSEVLRAKVEALRAAEKTDRYCQYHHHGPFFPGAAASLVDLAGDEQRDSLRLYQQMAASAGSVDTLPWTLVTLEEPLTPEKRALIYKIMTLENNAERYFDSHRGSRGGPWWLDPYTGCYCPMAGYMLTFLYLRNLFGEPRLFEKPIFSGFLTFQRYAEPFQDHHALQPNRRGPNGEPWRWIFTALTRHPLEKSGYQWEEWVAKMDGPLGGDERAQVDKLMALEGMALAGPLQGGVNYFTSGTAVPLALALGWYQPEAAEVTWAELPPTTVFDMEGWVAMRSGWDAKATEVTFVSGVRDHTSRNKPNHFTIIKGGNYLIGTPALMGDDGNNVAAWGNSVVIGDEWPQQWATNLQHPRDGEHVVINRFSPGGFTYINRNQKAFGYRPAEQGWGGGLNLHGHTETLFMREGRLLAYQTWPQLDFVAGDASSAWPADQVSQLDRQLVFMKPDLVVIYDRVKLGPKGHESKWTAATGPRLRVEGDKFLVQTGSERLTGRVLLPRHPTLKTPEPMDLGWVWKDQKLLTVAPGVAEKEVEYLVVLGAGGASEGLSGAELIADDRRAGVKLTVGHQTAEIRFHRTGPVGGEVVVNEKGSVKRYQLREAIVDSYGNWRSDPRHSRWISDVAFRFVVPEVDRR